MGVAAPVIAVVGAVATMAGTVMSAVSQSQAASYQAQIARNNAAIARNNQVTSENNAKATEAAGAARADQEAMQTRELIGKQKASAAASGLDLASGTPVDLTASAAGMGQWSNLNIRDETSRRAAAFRQQGQGYGMQAGNFDVGASAADTAASGAMVGGILGAAGAGVKGYTQTTGMLADFTRAGVGGGGVPQYDLSNRLR